MLARAAKISATLLAVLAIGCSDGGTSSDGPVPAVAIQSEVRTFVDGSRATPAKPGFDGAAERTVVTRLWYAPEAPRSAACGREGCALVILAHGFGGSTMRFDAIARFLAGRGYVVAAPAFPLTNEAAPGGHLSGIGDLAAQPGDVSFVIDELLAASTADGDLLRGRVDGERIGVIGHSLGGATVIALTRLACCTDPRVDAVIGVAAASFIVEGFFGGEIDPNGVPTLSLTGDRDGVVPSAGVRAFHDGLAPPRIYVQLVGANHVNLIENYGLPSPLLEPTERAAEAFFAAYLSGDRDGLAPTFDALAGEGQTVSADY